MAPRALDHIEWPTRDLETLAETFRRLGFTVGRRNRHPWGTINHIVQFDGCFVELLGFAADYCPLPPDDPAFPFAGFCADVLERSPGSAAMLVLRSDDAAADAAAFHRHGLGEGRLMPFSRAAQGPDGRDRTVAFTVAFAVLPSLPEVGAFACQQHRPENFWDPAAQRHANGAVGIGAVLIEVRDVTAARADMRRFADPQEPKPTFSGDAIPLPNSRIDIVPVPSENRLSGNGGRVAALCFEVRDLPRFGRMLDDARVPFAVGDTELRVSAPTADGTDLVFRTVGP